MAASDRVALISIDGHVGARASDLRRYCEKDHVDDFDAYMAAMAPMGQMLRTMFFGTEDDLPPQWQDVDWTDPEALHQRCLMMGSLEGHHDPQARLADLDRDGVAAEVLYFGSQNGEWLPFERFPLAEALLPGMLPQTTREQQAIGYGIYNRWLADFCATAPERLFGMAYIPTWDVDAAIAEMTWAREQGLRGVNWPTMRSGIPAFNDPSWDRLWAAAVDLGMPLSTHSGGAEMPGVDTSPGPESVAIMGSIDQLWFSRRALWWMACGGVFERHPGLKFVLTELPGAWWGFATEEMNGVYGLKGTGLQKVIPKPPREYVESNCYLGCSFVGRKDVELAIDDGWTGNFMWGCDYPHLESTWGYTTLSLNKSFEGVDEQSIRRIAGGNAAGVYGFDLDALAPLVDRIGPTIEQVSRPFDRSLIPPETEAGFAFRDGVFMS